MLESSLYHPKCDLAFKIINKSKFNNDYLKFNGNFKNQITFGITQERLL
jgi:hypothetical protein